MSSPIYIYKWVKLSLLSRGVNTEKIRFYLTNGRRMFMVKTVKCPHCGNDDIEQMRYVEQQLVDAEYLLIIQDGGIAVDLTHCLNRDWDGEVVKKRLRCKQCLEYFDDPGIMTIS